jgi:tRNA(fMet)-specific endonuclease VapC
LRPRFLLDTNVLSEPLSQSPDDRVLLRLSEHRSELATASLVIHELAFGAARLGRSARRRALERYLDQVVLPSMPVLSYDSQAALWHATERARLESKGRTAPLVDSQLAAIAAIHGLTLVTRNLRDFESFHELSCVSWHRD